MGAPKGSRNNPNGRTRGDPALCAVQFSIRIAPDIAAWVERSAKRNSVKKAKIINDALRLAMTRDRRR
jgi:hypothetical protein